MNNQTLVIYDFKVLYQILSEIEDQISFNLINIIKISELNFKNKDSIIKLIAKYNICMQRPIIRVNEKFVICRPPEKVLKYIKV